MRPNISEFSYGFALTNELIQSPGSLSAAPVFPSLFDEGQPGGGWDVRLDRPGVPLFLQFKLSEYMARRNCREVRDGNFSVPCYRMHLRRPPSRQHEMLIDLETAGAEVYYAAPAFHQPDELNAAFLDRTVRDRSIWVRPSQIGHLPDNREHHVSFQHPGPWAFFSKPREIEGSKDFEQVATRLQHELRQRGDRDLRTELSSLAESLDAIAEKRPDIVSTEKERTRQVLGETSPLRKVAHYASVFLDCQFFVVQESNDPPIVAPSLPI
jgi:hypothetical protein